MFTHYAATQSKHDVQDLFKKVQHLTAGTPTKTSINAILREYFRRHPRVKPLNFIIITDGAPNPISEYLNTVSLRV